MFRYLYFGNYEAYTDFEMVSALSLDGTLNKPTSVTQPN